jgi:hypothetical protein
MSTLEAPVSDMLVTVKSREVQRAMLAEMRGERDASRKHFLAAAHLELVLADDYEQAGESDLSFRSRMSAASCFWRAGQPEQARTLTDNLLAADPTRTTEIQQVLDELAADQKSSGGVR